MKNINKYLKCGIVLGALVYSVGTSIPAQSTYADEINTETVVKEWRPEGKVIATGEDGVPWELYENGYLLFKPEPGKDTLTNPKRSENTEGPSWKGLYGEQEVKAIGFTDKVYLPEDSSYLFANTHISGGTLAEYLDASKIDTSKVKNMNNMFNNSRFTKLDLNSWDTSNVEDMSSLFFNAALTELKIDKWNTSKVKNMSHFLYQVFSLKELDISNWNTSKVKDMTLMFTIMNNLEKLDLGKWDTSNVEKMEGMFVDTFKLKYLDITNFDTSKVNNFKNMFANSGLTRIKIGDKFAKTELKDGLFETLDFEYIGELLKLGQKYGNKWTRLDKNTQFYTVEEWNKVFRENPNKLAGVWVREKNYNGYEITFETGTDESIEPLEVEVGKDFELPVPTKVKEGYHFVGWSKTQDGEIIKDKNNLGKKNETVTLYAKWEKNPPVSTNTPIDENNNPILPPTVNDLPEYKGPLSTNTPVDDKDELVLPPVVNELPEYKGGANPIDSPVNEKPEYKGTLSTNTPVDDKGELVLPPVVNELPEYKGGVNPTDSLVNEKPEYKGPLSTNTPVDDKDELVLPPVVNELPEYKGGANPIDSPVNEKPEYKGTLSTNTPVDDKGELVLPPVVNELPEYNTPVNNSTVNNEKIETTKEETKKEKELPNTNSTSILTTLVSSVIGTLGLGYKSKRRK